MYELRFENIACLIMKETYSYQNMYVKMYILVGEIKRKTAVMIAGEKEGEE